MKTGHFGLATVVSLATLVGCQAAMPTNEFRQAAFSLGREDAAIAVTGRPALQSGELRVELRGALAQLKQRRVLATLTDVDHVVVTVTPTGASAVTQTVSKAAIVGGQTAATFSGLPAGVATVQVVVYDAAGTSLGTTSQSATVVAGQAASVSLTVMLSPTIVANSGGGSLSPSTGGLSTDIFIQEGAVVENLAGGGKVETFKLPIQPLQVAADSTGAVWVTASDPITFEIYLVKVSADGQFIKQVYPGLPLTPSIVIDQQDHLWVESGDMTSPGLVEFDANGAFVASHSVPSWPVGGNVMSVSASGRILSVVPPYGLFVWWQPDGTTGSLSTSGSTAGFGLQDDVWVGTNRDLNTDTPTADVVHYSATGAELGRYSFGAGYRSSYAATDAQGNVFVTGMSADYPVQGPGKLVKLSSTGALLASTSLSSAPFANQVGVSGDGTVWVLGGGSSGTDGTVTWLDGAAQEIGHVTLPPFNPWQFAVGENCAWVVDGPHQSLIKVTHPAM